jgi:hypothetical protein
MPAKESSLLFALDELRDIESQRQVELRHIAHKQAKERARVLAEEKREQKRKEEAAAELLRLKDHREVDARSRRILEAQIAADAKSIAALQSRVRMQEATLSQPATPPARSSNQIHLSWALALLAACASVFILADRRPEATPAIASSPSEPVTPAPAIAPLDCPQPEVTPAQPAPVVAERVEPAPPKQNRSTRRGTRTRPKPPVSQPIKIDDCMDDPLGCMPEE